MQRWGFFINDNMVRNTHDAKTEMLKYLLIVVWVGSYCIMVIMGVRQWHLDVLFWHWPPPIS
jgi:hypothetical protein